MPTRTRQSGVDDSPWRGEASVRARGFTLIDVMVSLAVIAVLIAIMAPSLKAAREATRRVVCASNTRQMGLGLQMYADANRGLVPDSRLLNRSQHGAATLPSEDMIVIRLADPQRSDRPGPWDGLGLLFEDGYLTAGEIFYCPSHPDEERFPKYASAFMGRTDKTEGVVEVVSNYQYRGLGPKGERDLYRMPTGAALVSDALGGLGWVNHEQGVNVLRAGLSVRWFGESEGISGDILLGRSGGASGAGVVPSVDDAWRSLDRGIDEQHPDQPGGAHGQGRGR